MSTKVRFLIGDIKIGYNNIMSDQYPPLRFDKREIAVIFSLFVFVSLLMFTVGIVVGKGLTQLKYERAISSIQKPIENSETKIKQVENTQPKVEEPTNNIEKVTPTVPDNTEDKEVKLESPTKIEEPKKNESPQKASLDLIPNEKAPINSLREPSKEIPGLLDNPKIKSLVEKEADHREIRKPAAVPKPANIVIPKSYPNGNFTVQIGSYPTKKEAIDRIEHLKTIGFPHAFMSVKKISNDGPLMYRVWLGYFNSTEEAKNGGLALQDKKEITSFIVRKSENLE